MNPSACIVAVDVGNTAVKLAVAQGDCVQGDCVQSHSIVIGQSRWECTAIDWVREKLGCRDTRWTIASVHRSAAERLIDAVTEGNSDAQIQLIGYQDVPMPVRIDHPGRLGIDRLLSAYAARETWGGPLVVVDAGSAVTIDWVDGDGAFCGGAILPGLTLQARALATGTDALPQIQWDAPAPVTLPAKNTADAIFGGILVGLAACIDAMATRYRTVAGSQGSAAQLVLTGGDSAVLSPQLASPHHQINNLVCRGLLNLAVS